MAKARKWNFRMAEKGVRHYPRVAGETTVQPSDVQRTLREIGRMWLSINRPGRAAEEAVEQRDRAAEVVEAVPTGF